MVEMAQAKSMFCLITISLFLSGCAQFGHFMESKGGEPQLFGGLRFHARYSRALVELPFADSDLDGERLLEQPQDWLGFGAMFLWWELIDLPLTFVTDVLMLPLHAYAKVNE